MRDSHIEFEGPAGALEGLWTAPSDPARGIAVVAHPHPLYGGTMHNAVVGLAAETLAERGLAVLRFNFRGVGASAGQHDAGRGETEDLEAAEAEARRRAADGPLWLVGYSFGAIMAMNRLAASDAATVTLLAPPVSHYDTSPLAACRIPLSVVCGTEDDVAPAAEIRRQSADWPSLTTLEVLEGAGHDLGTSAGGADLRAALARCFASLA